MKTLTLALALAATGTLFAAVRRRVHEREARSAAQTAPSMDETDIMASVGSTFPPVEPEVR